MAKGRKSAAKKKKSNKEAADAAKASSQPKVSDDEKLAPAEDVDRGDGLWDFVCVLSKDSDKVCRTEECDHVAVATWASNIDPEDKWDLCEQCQTKRCGGWPKGFNLMEYETQKAPDEPPKASEEKIPANDDQGANETLNASTGKVDDGAPEETTSVTAEAGALEANDKTSNEGGSPTETATPAAMDLESPKEESDPGKVKASEDEASSKLSGNESDKCDNGNNDSDSPIPSDPSEEDDEDQEDTVMDEEGDDEVWDLKKILSIPDLSKECTIKCSTEDCLLAACSIWVSNQAPTTKWYSCMDCQKKDFEGWPPIEERPIAFMTAEHKRVITEKCSNQKAPSFPKEESNAGEVTASEDEAALKPSGNDGDKSDSGSNDSDSPMSDSSQELDEGQEDTEMDEDGADEVWDLKKVLTVPDLSKDCTIKCSTADCLLAACSIWVSNQAPTTKWYSCMDCQEKDFQGWPTIGELPITFMTADHKRIITEKCSSQKAPSFPKLPTCAATSPKRENSDNRAMPHTITPPPSSVTMQARNKGMDSTVTPSPAVLADSRPPQQSKNLLKAHRKWQEQAEAMGGPDARIIVSKPSAKKLIFDMLHDAFCPMNITQIHKELKAVIPSPILKSCLDEMALDSADDGNPFADSDSEDEDKENKKSSKKSKATSDAPYAGSLFFKAGRNANTCLYYVDHTKLKNHGNGLEPEERNTLASDLMQAENEQMTLQQNLKSVAAETTKLLSEPTNEEATTSLETEEEETKVVLEKLEEARKLKVNEKHKKQTKKVIDTMTSHWRKRKRLCMDFLITMEESTDGAVSLKKCLAGDGQIEIDSDEAVIEGAIAFGKRRRAKTGMTATAGKKATKLNARNPSGAKRTNNGANGSTSGIPPSESFVGVRLVSTGKVCRVLIDEEPQEEQNKPKPRTSYC